MSRSVAAIPLALPPAGERATPGAHWAEQAWWDELIESALTTADPVLCNLRITLAHDELSRALRAVLGADTGANFHTWAVWGSKKAGSSIRQEDVPHLRRTAALVGGALGGGLGLLGTWAAAPTGGPLPLLAAALGGLAVGSAGVLGGVQHELNTTSRAILGGNRTVLDDIGRATARFIVAFRDHPTPDPARLATFLATLRPGLATQGGQDLLRAAFTHYDQARLAPDLGQRHEQMLLANLNAILHEHWRLQPYIARALPRLTRRWVTARWLRFQLGTARLDVHHDVRRPTGAPGAFPTTLAHLENPDLVRFLAGPEGWDRTPDSLAGSGAADWSNIHDRMNYICDLFRSHHCDPNLFAAPYSAAQCAAVAAGQIPAPLL